MPLLSTDDLASKASGLPSTDELASRAGPFPDRLRGSEVASHGLFSGEYSDYFFSQGPASRVLRAFGQGAQEGWGAAQTALPEDSQKELQKNGLAKHYGDAKDSVLKSANEAWMRSAASNLYNNAQLFPGITPKTIVGLGLGAIQAVSGATAQTGAELEDAAKTLNKVGVNTPYGRLGLGTPVGEAGEYLKGVGSGEYLPEIGLMPHPHIDQARSVGAIGESENKFFGTVDLSANDRAMRAEALGNSIQSPETPSTIHSAARAYAPAEFSKYDVLQGRQKIYRSAVNRLEEEQKGTPEYQEAQKKIDDILESVNHDESELSDTKADELSAAREKLITDTPALAEYRGLLKDTNKEITDLSPAIQDAYRLADNNGERLEPGTGIEPTPETPKVPQKSAAELSRGAIAQDVQNKLISAGRPLDEAKTAGILWQQRYENRVLTSPHLGTAEDLYRREGPDIIRGGKDTKESLNQYVGTKAFRASPEGIKRSSQLSTAVKLESAGKTPEEITKATGWFRSPLDKQWKYEITDSDSDLMTSFAELKEPESVFGEVPSKTLGEVLHHPRLFEAYPEAKDIKITKQKSLFDFFGSIQGWFDKEKNTINIAPHNKEPLSTILHEVQHWIQNKEGFARGGNTQTVIKSMSPEKLIELFQKTIQATQEKYESLAGNLSVLQRVKQEFNAEEAIRLHQEDQATYQKLKDTEKEFGHDSPEARAVSTEWLNIRGVVRDFKDSLREEYIGKSDYFKMTESEKDLDVVLDDLWDRDNPKSVDEVIQKVQKSFVDLQENITKLQAGDQEALKKNLKSDEAYRLYHHIAGEIEARDTQERVNLSEEERRLKEPYSSQTFDPNDVITTFNQDKRGSLTRDTPRNIIRLFEKADASTFFHETGHQWLEELTKDAGHEKAGEGLKVDLQTVRDYLGNDGTSFTRAQHEKFARSFERYLREGNAPSKELSVIFARFKEWLTAIYKTLRQLPGTKMSDEVRDVFDRLIVPERTRTVIAPDELNQRGPSRSYQIEQFRRDVEERARTREINNFITEMRVRAAAKDSEGTLGGSASKRFIGAADIIEKKPTPYESQGGEAEVVSNAPETKGKPSTDPNAEVKVKSGPLVDPAGNVRVENLTSDTDLQDSIRQSYEANKEELDKVRGKVSSQAVIDLSQAGGIKTDEINMQALQASADAGGIPLSAYIDILRKTFVESAKNIKAVAAGQDVIAFAEATTRHMAITRHLMGITGEWGRAGHSFRSIAEEAKAANELTELLQATMGKSEAQLKQSMELVRKLDTSEKISGFVRDSEKSSIGEGILEAFKNWLISGPITHLTYAVGNELFAISRLFEAGARVGLSTLRGAGEGSSEFGEVVERAYGILSGHKDAFKIGPLSEDGEWGSFFKSFVEGQTALLPGEERATTAFTQHREIPDYKYLPLGSIVRIPSERMVAPLHSLARSVAFMEERNGLIYRKAVSEGLEGQALQRRIAELKANVPVDITVKARAQASESALMGKAGEFTRKAVALFNQEIDLPGLGKTRPGGFIAPFITVSSNINRLALLERTPLGIFSSRMRNDWLGRNGRFAQETALSKLIVGTALGTTVGAMYLEGNINPAGPEDFKHAAVEQMVNGQPHAIRIGDMSYDINRLGILGSDIAIAADFAAFAKHGVYDAYKAGDPHMTADAATEWFHGLVEHITQEGFLSGVTDVVKAVEDSGRYGESWTKNFLSTALVPYSIGMTQIAQRIDPYKRDTKGTSTLETIRRAIVARIPFESESLEEKVDIFGSPVPNREYWGVYATQISNDPVWKALKDVGYFPAPVKRTILGVDLTPEQYHEYAVKAGVTSKMLLNNIVNMPGFETLSPTVKHDLVKEAVTSGRQAGASAVLAEYANSPESIIQKAIDMKIKLAQGTPE